MVHLFRFQRSRFVSFSTDNNTFERSGKFRTRWSRSFTFVLFEYWKGMRTAPAHHYSSHPFDFSSHLFWRYALLFPSAQFSVSRCDHFATFECELVGRDSKIFSSCEHNVRPWQMPSMHNWQQLDICNLKWLVWLYDAYGFYGIPQSSILHFGYVQNNTIVWRRYVQKAIRDHKRIQSTHTHTSHRRQTIDFAKLYISSLLSHYNQFLFPVRCFFSFFRCSTVCVCHACHIVDHIQCNSLTFIRHILQFISLLLLLQFIFLRVISRFITIIIVVVAFGTANTRMH